MHESPPTYPFGNRPSVLDAPGELRGLRERPAVRVTLPSGDPGWVVTRYEDIRVLLSDPRLRRDRSSEDLPRITKDNSMFQDPNVSLDPPEHPRMRRLVTKALSAARVEKMRPHVQALVDELLDAMEAAGPTADLAEALAFPLGIRTLCGLLGVPPEDQKDFRLWTDAYLSVNRYSAEEVARYRGELFGYIQRLVAAKREQPGDDLISSLIAVRDEDESRLGEYELLYWVQGLLMGGYESTANHLAAAVVTLLAHPEELAKVREDPSLVPAAVEELLRYQVLFSQLAAVRYSTEDIEVGGVTIPAGSAVFLALESANRDEQVFKEPDALRLDRDDNKHLSFSAGPHFCAGSALARMELQTAIGTLLRRYPDLRLTVPAQELSRNTGVLVEGFTEVPVTW
ncbi:MULTISPECIES: cytochrome P450 [unclassified Streptomyces]|uniref:cytochrome P450 n=1 Tax=unclassified Streptomyces TaxID=2593676 RepID=UPI0036E8A58C